MILGPDGVPIDVAPCPLAPPIDRYDAYVEWIILMHNAGAFRHDNEDGEE